jgi:acetylglutamate kinase
VKRATVVDGRTPHALLLEMFTTEGTGTMVVPADQSSTDLDREGTA